MIIPVPLPERQLISRICQLRATAQGKRHAPRRVIRGIGDDCAVLRIPAKHELLATTDFSLEGVHFRREWDSAEHIGHRCVTRGLSDIAAMGGEPIAVFLSLAVPKTTKQSWVDGFLKGLLKLATSFSVPLAGGDSAQSNDGVLADIVVLGSVPAGTAILRSGARPGDSIYVTGELGSAAAEVTRLYATIAGEGARATRSERQRRNDPLPIPRIHVANILREREIATAMIDISDGLSTDLSHICQESGVGAELTESLIPRAMLAGKQVDLQFALHGGDAYELLFTAAKRTRVPPRIDGVKVTHLGEITKEKKMTLVAGRERTPLLPQGWQHFQPPSSRK